jgi:hypothetical protein
VADSDGKYTSLLMSGAFLILPRRPPMSAAFDGVIDDGELMAEGAPPPPRMCGGT